MSDTTSTLPAVPPQRDEYEGLSFDTLDKMRAELVGGKASFDELSEAELEKFVAICGRLRLTARTASKPKANGGGRTKKEKAPVARLIDMI